MLLRNFISLLFLVVSLLGCGGSIGSDEDSPCDVPSDRASDGSKCGDRASSERPGGK